MKNTLKQNSNKSVCLVFILCHIYNFPFIFKLNSKIKFFKTNRNFEGIRQALARKRKEEKIVIERELHRSSDF